MRHQSLSIAVAVGLFGCARVTPTPGNATGGGGTGVGHDAAAGDAGAGADVRPTDVQTSRDLALEIQVAPDSGASPH